MNRYRERARNARCNLLARNRPNNHFRPGRQGTSCLAGGLYPRRVRGREGMQKNITEKAIPRCLRRVRDMVLESTIRIVRCPACGRFVRATVYDGRVKGWCTVQRRYVNAAVEEVVDNATRNAENER